MKISSSIYIVLILAVLACTQERGKFGEEDEGNPKTLGDSTEAQGVKEVSNGSFGDKVNKEGAVPANTLATLMEKVDSMEIKVSGEVVEVCQKKGCWMTMDLGQGELMRISFKDYGFFVPKDAHGKEAIVKGTAKKKITSIDELKHYAEDAGKSKNEVEAIKEAKEELVFIADGVVLIDK